MTWRRIEGPSVWDPKEGDQIEGVYLNCQPETGENKANLYSIEVNGEVMLVWGSMLLDKRMKQIKTGDRIKIIYEGIPEGKKYKIYHVEIDE